jgi:hypothetical protein
MGKPAVTGAARLHVDTGTGVAHARQKSTWDILTMDGTSGSMPRAVDLVAGPCTSWICSPGRTDTASRVRANAARPLARLRQGSWRRWNRSGSDRAYVRRATAGRQRIILSVSRPSASALAASSASGWRLESARVMDELPVVVRLLDPHCMSFSVGRLEQELRPVKREADRRPSSHVRPGSSLGEHIPCGRGVSWSSWSQSYQ